MAPFELSENEISLGCREIKVQGELDLAVSGELAAAIDQALGKGQDVLVDLSACEFMDVSAHEVLLRGMQSLRGRGRELLLTGVHGQVERLLSVLGYRSLIAAPRRPTRETGSLERAAALTDAA